MMEVVYAAVAVLSLLSVGHAAPATDCDSLLQPLEIQGTDQLLGKWITIAEGSDSDRYRERMAVVENARTNITAVDGVNVVRLDQMQKVSGRCIPAKMWVALNGTLYRSGPADIQTNLLPTSCTDCAVFKLRIHALGTPYTVLMLMSRSEKVSDAELQEFLKQVQCLNLPSQLMMDPKKGLCPEPPTEEPDSDA